MTDSTVTTPDAPPNYAPPARPEGLHYVTSRERYDRIGMRRGSSGSRLRHTVYDGHVRLVTYYDRRLAERHVEGKAVILDCRGAGYVVWKGAQSERFDTLAEARDFARGKEEAQS